MYPKRKLPLPKEIGWKSRDDWRWDLMTARAIAKHGRRGRKHKLAEEIIKEAHRKRLHSFNARCVKHGHRKLSLIEYADVLAVGGGVCNRCKVKESVDLILGVDHVIPLWYGGSSEPHNLQALCWPCNKAKSVSAIDYRCSPPRQYLIDDKTLQVVVKEL